jgi:hypothetical protein
MTPPDQPTTVPTDQHPAIITPASSALAAEANATNLVPPPFAAACDQSALRYIDFFTANIRNPNKRRAYARACSRFFA